MNNTLITKEFAEELCRGLNNATGEKYKLKQVNNNFFFELENSYFNLCIYQYKGTKLNVCLSELNKQFYDTFNEYVTHEDMGIEVQNKYERYEPEELGFTYKTKVEALLKRTLKELPNYKKFYAVALAKCIALRESKKIEQDIATQLKSKYKIDGNHTKVGYVNNHRIEITISGKQTDLKITNLDTEKLFKLLDTLN
jgi:hypothetical protein